MKTTTMKTTAMMTFPFPVVRTTAGAALLIALCAHPVAAALTLEGILSAPYLSDLVASSSADRIAWVANERGVRNLWTAAAPDFTPRSLTTYEADDGRALSGLMLTPDGSLLLYTRGGAPNRAGEVPNPDSDPDGAERAVWAVSTTGGAPWQVTAGGSGVIGPDGKTLFLARGSQVSTLVLEPTLALEPTPTLESPSSDASEEAPPAQVPEAQPLFQARGGIGQLAFSPDGQRLAFVSQRGTHSFIGIFDLQARTLSWVSPDVDRDSHPVWSPDGRHLAFLRAPGGRADELFDLTAQNPFALWVGDPATGTAHQVWASPGADGGFAQFMPAAPLRWADEQLLFTSEHDGWLHLYALPITSSGEAGGEAIDLTPGAGEVETSALSADGKTLVWSSNHGDSARRHLWRVATRGGPATPLTHGAGLESEPVLLPGGNVAYRAANARQPPAIEVLPLAGGTARRVAPSAWPADHEAQVEPQAVQLKAADGLVSHGQLFLPPGAAAGDGRPAVIFLHGGPVRQMLLGWHNRGYYANAYAYNQFLSAQGYVVLALNYRCGIGYGRDFRLASEQGPRGAAEYRDLLAAGRYLQQRPEVDPSRIGLWGGSYGGYLTALGLARDSDLFAAGVDLHGVHDWALRARELGVPGGAWGIAGEAGMTLAHRSSPVADLAYWSAPVLFVHGDDDRNVLFLQTTDLVRRLRARDVHVETLVFPDEVHGFLRHENWLRTFRAATDFFDRFLDAKRLNAKRLGAERAATP